MRRPTLSERLRTWTAALGIVLFTTGCDEAINAPLVGTASGSSPSGRAAQQHYTGEEIFRGLLMERGEVAQLVPQIRDQLRAVPGMSDPDQQRAIDSFQERVMAGINELDPAFFPTFAAEIQSGNHLKIDRALRSAGPVTMRAISRMPEIQELRERIKEDPQLLTKLTEAVQLPAAARARVPDQARAAEIERALQAQIARLLLEKDGEIDVEDPSLQGLFIFGGIFIVYFFGVWLMAALVEDVGAVLNVAAAINLYVVVAGELFIVMETDEPYPESAFQWVDNGGSSLLYEQVVHSVARYLKAE